MRKREIKNSVVVITGAGTGIGRATAIRFSKRGARLVLVGRSRSTLEVTAAECRKHGAKAEVIAADVGDEQAIERVAERAVTKFGQLDTWVNNAGVAMYGGILQMPAELFEQVIRTNVFGYLNGMRAALRRFEKRGTGVVINNLSVVGKIGVPYFSSYAVSKAALFMLSECAREEYAGTDIHVCAIVTPTVDTGVYQRVANYTGRAVRPFPPIYSPFTVADAIVRCAERPRREINVGPSNWLMRFGHGFAPGIYERITPVLMRMGAFRRGRAALPTEGNLRRPMLVETGIRAGWQKQQKRMALAALGGVTAASLLSMRVLASSRARKQDPTRSQRAA